MNISAFDLLIIVVYCLTFILVGIYINKKKVKTAADFNTAGQSMGLWTIVGTTTASCMGATIVFGNYEIVHRGGMSGLASSFAFYIGWWGFVLLCGHLRRSNATTLPGFLEEKYDLQTRRSSSIFVGMNAIANTAAQFLAFGTMCAALNLCDTTKGTVIGAVIILLFTVFSGLWGVAITDAIQSIGLLIACLIVIPVAVFRQAGGIGTVFAQTPPEMLNPLKGLPLLTLAGYFLSNFLIVIAHPSYSQRVFAAKDEKTAVRGQIISCILCSVVVVIAVLPAFAIRIIYPDMAVGSEFVPRFIADYMPIGITGILLALILGLLLTTGDTYLLLLSSTIVEDLIKPSKKDVDDVEMLKLSRILTVVLTAIVLVMALYVKSIYELFIIGSSAYGAAMAFPVLFGCLSKDVSAKYTNIAILAGGGISFLWDMTLKASTGVRGVFIGATINLIFCIIGVYAARAEKAKNAK